MYTPRCTQPDLKSDFPGTNGFPLLSAGNLLGGAEREKLSLPRERSCGSGTVRAGQDVASAGQDPAPVGQDVAPAGQDAAPVWQDVAPVWQDAAPAGQDAAPVGQDAAPVWQDVAPVGQDVAPVGQDAAPVGQDVAPVWQDVAPAGQVAARIGQITVPSSHRGASLTFHGLFSCGEAFPDLRAGAIPFYPSTNLFASVVLLYFPDIHPLEIGEKPKQNTQAPQRKEHTTKPKPFLYHSLGHPSFLAFLEIIQLIPLRF